MPDQQTPQPALQASASEAFRTVPHDSESFRMVPKASERTENHILSVREAAKLFEAAGVTRTERSITNWCQPNKSGVPRLDAYFDSNDRKYFITPQSIDAVIKEELAKAARHSELSDTFGSFPHNPEKRNEQRGGDGGSDEIEELRFKLRESEISSRVKDQVIARLEKQSDATYQDLLKYSRLVGQLETQLLQLEGPKASKEEPVVQLHEPRRIHVVSEDRGAGMETQ